MNYAWTYFRCLFRADLQLNTDARGRCMFNGFSTPGDFNSQLRTCEVMMTHMIAEWRTEMQKNSEFMLVLKGYVRRIEEMFVSEPKVGYVHGYLSVFDHNHMIPFEHVTMKMKKEAAFYTAYQYESFKRVKSMLFPFSGSPEDDYAMQLAPTELVELAMFCYASGRMMVSGGQATQIGVTRFLSRVLGVSFPDNYDSLKAQITNREQSTKFIDFVRKLLINYILKK